MHAITLVLVAIVALEHVYFLYLEMFRWTSPATLRAFGTTIEQDDALLRQTDPPLTSKQRLFVVVRRYVLMGCAAMRCDAMRCANGSGPEPFGVWMGWI